MEEPYTQEQTFIASYLVPIYEELKKLNKNIEALKKQTARKKEEE